MCGKFQMLPLQPGKSYIARWRNNNEASLTLGIHDSAGPAIVSLFGKEYLPFSPSRLLLLPFDHNINDLKGIEPLLTEAASCCLSQSPSLANLPTRPTTDNFQQNVAVKLSWLPISIIGLTLSEPMFPIFASHTSSMAQTTSLASTEQIRLGGCSSSAKSASGVSSRKTFFNMPRKIRDRIYDMLAPCEARITSFVALRENEHPCQMNSACGGLIHCSREVREEYSEAVARYLERTASECSDEGTTLFPRPTATAPSEEFIPFL